MNYDDCDSCDSINYHRTLSGTNCVCQTGYVDNGTASCYSCSSIIKGCSNCNNETICTVCNSGYTVQVINASHHDCVACHHSCSACTLSGTLVCTSCPTASQRTFVGSNSTCPCNIGFFDDNNTVICEACSSIDADCLECDNRSHCTQCSSGLHLTRSH